MTTRIDRYRLKTAFDGDDVIHTTYKSDLAAGRRKVEIKTRWKRKKDIGEGGFGVVSLEEAEGGTEVRAVKRLYRGAQRVDWSRELNTLAKLKDLHDETLFVQFLGWYENRDFVFIAMEYIEHGDLSQYLKTFRPKAKLEAKEIVRQLLEGLKILHELNICHRDLKPQNVLIASHSPIWVKITDFGGSKREKNTKLRTHFGTTGYLAPELLGLLPKTFERGDSYTNAVDMWSLGALTHEILTSKVPFLENIHLSSSELELGIEPPDPQVDMELLFEYCRGNQSFPIDVLQLSQVENPGVDFVRSLLVVDPAARASAKSALESQWLLDKDKEIVLGPGNPQIKPELSQDPTATANTPPAPIRWRLGPTYPRTRSPIKLEATVGPLTGPQITNVQFSASKPR